MKNKKKYNNGGSVKNMIPNPAEILAQNSINIAKARYQSEMDPFANALQYGTHMATGIAGSMDFSKMGKDKMAFGGNVSNVPVEVEGKEALELPNGMVGEVTGASHEAGGVDMNLPEGTEVFSKRLKMKGKTMAERKLAREKREKALQAALTKDSTDGLLKKGLERTQAVNAKEEEFDMGIQEFANQMETSGQQVMKNGGRVKYSGGTSGTGISAAGHSPNPWSDKILEEERLKKLTPSPEKFAFGQSQELIPGASDISEQSSTKRFDMSKVNMPEIGANVGDMIGLAGNVFNSVAPMMNTLNNRATDTPNINPYENFGEDALNSMDESKQYVGQMRDNENARNQRQTNANISRGRNSARGVNTMRALDVNAQQMHNQQSTKIDDTFSQQMMNIHGQEAQLENQQDQFQMRGESMRDEADRMDKDAYYSQMAQDLLRMGTGIQQTGKDINAIQQDDTMVNLMKSWGINVEADKNGNMIVKDGQSKKKVQKENDREIVVEPEKIEPRGSNKSKLEASLFGEPSSSGITQVIEQDIENIQKGRASAETQQTVKKEIEAGNTDAVLQSIGQADPKAAKNPLQFANKFLGLNEKNSKHQSTIKAFLNKAVPGFIDKDSEVTSNESAWCAAFVNHVLTQTGNDSVDTGGDSYNYLRAQSYASMGTPVNGFEEAEPGDVMVIKNKKTNQYHTAFYSGKKGGKNLMLGGNQNDMVNVTEFRENTHDLVAVRRVNGMEPLPEEELNSIMNTPYFDGSSSLVTL